MISLTDFQLQTVMTAASALEPEKRDLYLQRIAAMLTMRGRGHFNDSDVSDVAKLALTGLAHHQQPEIPQPPVQRIQILGSATGDFFGTQIGTSQPAHGH
jgi:hypothetical protein